MFHSLYAAVSLGFLSYLPSSMGKHIKVCPLGRGDDVGGPDKLRTFLDIFIVKAIRAPG